MSRLSRFVLLLAALLPAVAAAEPPRIAVASNFTEAARALAERFHEQTGEEVVLTFGSTGKLYAQVRHGAPFAALFAADVRRPRLLEEQGEAVAGSRFTYAVGQLVLWSARPGFVDGPDTLRKRDFRHLAIANPRLAPYGAAARAVLENQGLWQTLRGRMVRGENIGQAYQFVRSGNAALGFVAYSQVKRPDKPIPGSHWAVPPALYPPVEQQAVLLDDDPVARRFLAFVRSAAGREIIAGYGYTAH